MTSTFVLASVLDTLTLSPFIILAGLSMGLGAGAIFVPAVLGLATVFFGHRRASSSGKSFLWAVSFCALGRAPGLTPGARRPPFLHDCGGEVQVDGGGGSRAIREKRSLFPLVRRQSLVIRLAKYISVFALFYGLLKSRGLAFTDCSFPGSSWGSPGS